MTVWAVEQSSQHSLSRASQTPLYIVPITADSVSTHALAAFLLSTVRLFSLFKVRSALHCWAHRARGFEVLHYYRGIWSFAVHTLSDRRGLMHALNHWRLLHNSYLRCGLTIARMQYSKCYRSDIMQKHVGWWSLISDFPQLFVIPHYRNVSATHGLRV